MHRIASALLITAAVLALNTGLVRDAFAAELKPRIPVERSEAAQPQSAKLLSLLVVLESLRQLDGQKV